MQIHPENIPRPPSRRLTARYIVALSAVALLLILGQVLVQVALMRQSSDSHVINIAGRQRMLSQKVSKAALAIQVATDPAVRRERLKELQSAVTLCERSHLGLLRGDAAMNLPGTNSAEVNRMFSEIEPHHQAMLEAAKGLLAWAAREDTGATAGSDTARFAGRILAEEAAFLVGMNEIVFQYDREAKARIDRLKQVELMLLSITLIVLLLIGLVLFRPVVRKIDQTITALERTDGELRKLNQELEQRVVERTAEVRTSEKKFRGLLEAAPNGIVVVNHEGRIKFVNAQTEKMFGYNREELLGQPIETLLPDRSREAHVAHRATYSSKPSTRLLGAPLDLVGLRKDGSEVPLDISLSPLETDEGRLVISVIRDITERKQAERELARLAAFPELSPHPVLECDPDGQLLYANPAARRLLRIHETSNPDLCLFFPDLSQLVKRCLENNVEIQGKEIQSGGKTFLWSLSPIPETNHVHIHATDITERKRLQLYESILPVCCVCGKVRDDTGTERGKGSWESLQTFVTEHSDTSLSHTFCPPCYQEYRQQQGLPPEEP